MTTQFWWLHSQHNSRKPKPNQPSSSSTPLSDQSNTTQLQASAHDVTSSLELLEGTPASLKGKVLLLELRLCVLIDFQNFRRGI